MTDSQAARDQRAGGPAGSVPYGVVHGVFFSSGFAAVIYQIVWQRALLTLIGATVESVTVVVTAFMLGLGGGSLIGGLLVSRTRIPSLVLFALIEIGIGLFGLASLSLFQAVGVWTIAMSNVVGGLAAFALLLIPTALMGATLPVLTSELVDRSDTIGRSVGGLYAINTLGSSAGAFAGVVLLFALLGQRGSVALAAMLNLLTALVVLLWRRGRPEPA